MLAGWMVPTCTSSLEFGVEGVGFGVSAGTHHTRYDGLYVWVPICSLPVLLWLKC